MRMSYGQSPRAQVKSNRSQYDTAWAHGINVQHLFLCHTALIHYQHVHKLAHCMDVCMQQNTSTMYMYVNVSYCLTQELVMYTLIHPKQVAWYIHENDNECTL